LSSRQAATLGRLIRTCIRIAAHERSHAPRRPVRLLEQIVKEAPGYSMKFDKSGKIVSELVKLIEG
jgi:hypothetical protein